MNENRPIAIELEAVRKVYRLYGRPSDRLWEALGVGRRHRELVALDGVGLRVPRGTVLGVVGENGAGKSTLLKLVAGVSDPTSGRVRVEGKVASILELGAGFHPEFSGRENARLNAAVLGVEPTRIGEILERTREFSELGDFFDRPVRTYSSGMVMRLAFTIATEIDPEVLIIDEALAVGDGHFQKKSADRIVAFRDRGKTILFCTHAMYFITTLCDRAVWLSGGRVVEEGLAADVVSRYEAFLQEKDRQPREQPTALPMSGSDAKPAWITAVRLLDRDRREVSELETGDDLLIEVEVETSDPELPFQVRIGIDRTDDVQVFAADTMRDGAGPLRGARRHRLTCRFPAFPVRSGELNLFVYVGDEQALVLYDHVLLQRGLRIRPHQQHDVGIVELGREWSSEPLA